MKELMSAIHTHKKRDQRTARESKQKIPKEWTKKNNTNDTRDLQLDHQAKLQGSSSWKIMSDVQQKRRY